MKIKFNVAQGCMVKHYENNYATLQEALELLQREEVIGIIVTKQTPSQYLKTVSALNDTKLKEANRNG